MTDGLLAPYRVLDLTDGRAELAGFMMAGLGADVIKVEPPGGAASRREGPIAAGEVGDLASLHFHAYNRGKRSIVLDLDEPAGRADFEALVSTAHFVFENAGPGMADARGRGFDVLRSLCPDIVMVSISPFGQDGPYADHLATDLTLAAMGGQASLCGDPDRRPVRITVPQTWLHASAEAVVGALFAHERRLATGQAQFVDTAVQPAVFWTGLNAMIKSAIDGTDAKRCGTELHLSTNQTPLVHPAADGEVTLVPLQVTLAGLLPWMLEAGTVSEAWLAAEDWTTWDRRILDGDPVHYSQPEVRDKVAEFTSKHTKAELLGGAIERDITVVPVSTAADVAEMDQLAKRDYWEEIALPSGRTVRAPGPFAKTTVPIGWAGPAPAVDQHGDEIRASLGPPRAPLERVRPERRLPMEGLKIADFSWIGVGPISAKAFADHGATVVRIESDDPPDRLRLVGPFTDGVLGINRCQFYGSFNTSKKSLQLNLKHPEGQAVARAMLEWCDVAINSFAAGTMDKLGLGYDIARELNPGIVMVETCLFGQTGPLAKLAGYGYHAASISGFYEVTGWSDRSPGGPWNAYTDTVAPRFLVPIVLAALDHRRRTGHGHYIDLAQAEAALHFLGPQVLDVQLTGVSARRDGNRAPGCTPHDMYPCLGDDQWCAIAVETDDQWARLVEVLGSPAWATDPELATEPGRRARVEEIDRRLGDFTSQHAPHELMRLLQQAGVPAGAVQRSSDLLQDPQLEHRNFFRRLQHPEMGVVPYEGHQYRIDGYDNGPRGPAPCLGEHTFEVLTELLGLSPERAAEILSSGACG